MKNINRVKIYILKRREIICLGILLLIILISHSLYVYKTYQFPQWDENVYLQQAVDIMPILKNPTPNLWKDILNIVKYRQPFYPFFISLPLLFLGTEHAYKIALYMNGLFYSTTIIATYLLAKEFLNKKISLLAAFIFAFYGFPLFYIHFALQETTATSFIILSLLFLAKTIKNYSLKNTFFFSLFFAIGTLTRWATPVFLLGPFFILLSFFVKNKIIFKNKKIFLKHVCLFSLIGVIPILMFYYIPNFSFFSNYVEGNISGGSKWAPDPIKNSFSMSSAIWYANALAQQTIFFWLLFISGIIIIFFKFKKYKFLFFSFLIPYLFLTFGSTWKDDRFIMPIYPTMAIISCVVIYEIKKPVLKKFLIICAITIGSLNFLGASWGVGPMKFSITGEKFVFPNSILVPMPIGHPRRVWLAPISWPPRPNEGNAPLILKTITKDFHYEKGKKPTILLTFDFSQIGDPIAVKAAIENPSLLNFSQLYLVEDYKILFLKIKNSDYLLVKTGRIYDESRKGQKVVYMIQLFNDALKQNSNKPPAAFKPLKKIIVPIDNSTLTIYKKIRNITKDEWKEFANKIIAINPSLSSEVSEAINELNLKSN